MQALKMELAHKPMKQLQKLISKGAIPSSNTLLFGSSWMRYNVLLFLFGLAMSVVIHEAER